MAVIIINSSASSENMNTSMPKKRRKIFTSKTIFSFGTFDWTFFITVIILLCVGVVMMFSASYAYADYVNNNSLFYVKKQIKWAIVGIVIMLAMSFLNTKFIRMAWIPALAVTYVLLIAVLIMPEKNNVHRWLNIGGFSFQPTEIAKFALILSFAHLMAHYNEKMRTFRYGVLPFVLILGSIVLLVVVEPHLSATVIICLIAVCMMLIGGTRFIYFAIFGAIAVLAFVWLVFFSGKFGYMQERFEIWMDPFLDQTGSGWQTIQSLYAIASGGLVGTGIGNSKQKFMYVSEPQNDFVFAIVCEELGFVGAVLIILLFVILLWRGFVIAMNAKDKFSSYLTIGIILQLGIQVMLNICVVTNTIPNTGISLPFFSYGGSSMIMLLAQMGIVLSVSKKSYTQKT